MIEIYAINQEKRLDNETFNWMLNLVSEEKRDRINRFLRWEDAQRSLVGDVLLRILIQDKLKLKNNEIVYTKNKFGKPSLNNIHDFSFNISHSGKWVVCALSKHHVGIDVEKIKPTDFGIAKKYFSTDEYEFLMNQTTEDRLEVFYNLWTLKESYIKAIGKGLYKPLDEFTISFTDSNIYLNDQIDDNHYNFKQYSIDKEYKLSLCISGEIQNDILRVFSL